MLNVFQRENVTNVVCVVTRYFGGILLGAGGLTRAYSKGARDALCAAGYAVMGRWAVVDIPCSYALFERVRLEAAAQGGTVDDTQYGADIHLTVSLPEERVETLQERAHRVVRRRRPARGAVGGVPPGAAAGALSIYAGMLGEILVF